MPYPSKGDMIDLVNGLCQIQDRIQTERGFDFMKDPKLLNVEALKVPTCNHSPRIVGNVFSSPMIEDVNYWNTFANSQYKPDYCNGYKALSSCDASCREVANILNGSPCEIDPTLAINQIQIYRET